MKFSTYILIIFSFISLPFFGQQNEYLSGDIMQEWEGGPAYYAQWANGPSADSNFFPITVWYQAPSAAVLYSRIGVNYFNYWGDVQSITNDDALVRLNNYNMSGVTAYTPVYANSQYSHVMKGWMHETDEPDNAQNGTQSPMPPADLIADYNQLKITDPTRPIFLNLGQGVAVDSWYGRGNRTNRPEDYIEYAKAADVLLFDVYPMNVEPIKESDYTYIRTYKNEARENIWLVAKGVERLRAASDYKKPVWAWIETTCYNTSENCHLTPAITVAEAWMAIIHGARGIGYFCHILNPSVIQAGVLNSIPMKNALTKFAADVRENAPVINSQTVANGATVSSSNEAVPVDFMVKRHGGYTYIYAISMRPGATQATFTLRDFVGDATVEVVGEARTITSSNGVFTDDFADYSHHIYKVKTPITNSVPNVVNKKHALNARYANNELTISADATISHVEIYTTTGMKFYDKTLSSNQLAVSGINWVEQAGIVIVKAKIDGILVTEKVALTPTN